MKETAERIVLYIGNCYRSTEMTELEKCNAGELYRFDDPEMVARKTAAIRECEAFNAIGDRAVVGAGSVVTEDIPADSVAVGAPARVVRNLAE